MIAALPMAVLVTGSGPTHEFMESVAAFRARADLSDAAKTRILYDNPRRLYRL